MQIILTFASAVVPAVFTVAKLKTALVRLKDSHNLTPEVSLAKQLQLGAAENGVPENVAVKFPAEFLVHEVSQVPL